MIQLLRCFGVQNITFLNISKSINIYIIAYVVGNVNTRKPSFACTGESVQNQGKHFQASNAESGTEDGDRNEQ